MSQTKDLLLLEKTNWEKFDEKAHTIMKSMTARLKNIGYEARIFGSLPVTPALFNLVSCPL